MKGWVFGPELRDDLPEPEGEIVAVKATSVNAIDTRATSGVLGHDFAGVTEDGSEVFGFVLGGAWSERIARGPFVAPKPASLSRAEAGAAGVAGTFALAYVESLRVARAASGCWSSARPAARARSRCNCASRSGAPWSRRRWTSTRRTCAGWA